MITLQSKTATVYRGAKRNYLTKAGAYRSLAWAAIEAKYPRTLETAEYDDFGRTIAAGGWGRDLDDGYAKTVATRLARWLAWRDRCGASASAAGRAGER